MRIVGLYLEVNVGLQKDPLLHLTVSPDKDLWQWTWAWGCSLRTYYVPGGCFTFLIANHNPVK